MQWNVALDIGASGVRMAVRGRGLAYQESAAIAMRAGESKPLFIGNSALPLYGRASGQIRSGFPMDAGQVADEAALRAWFSYLLREVSSLGLAHRPRVLIARSPEAGSYTIKALVALCNGGWRGRMQPDPVGFDGGGGRGMRPECGLRARWWASWARGSMSVTLFSLGRAVETRALPWGLRKADEAIQTLLRNEYALETGPQTAEELKLSLLSALGGTKLAVDVRGLDLNLSLPRTRSHRSGEAARGGEACGRGFLLDGPCGGSPRADRELAGRPRGQPHCD